MTATPPCGDCAKPYACSNCRRPLEWVEGIGWLHSELPQYAGEPMTCGVAEPVHERQGSRHDLS